MTNEPIQQLNDKQAMRILTTYSRAKLNREGGGLVTELSPELEGALRGEFAGGEGEPEGEVSASEGELARQTLLLLWEDEANRGPLSALIKGPESKSFEIIGTIAVITAALVALQTKVSFHRTSTGKVSIKIEKGAANDQLLQGVVKLLLALFKSERGA